MLVIAGRKIIDDRFGGELDSRFEPLAPNKEDSREFGENILNISRELQGGICNPNIKTMQPVVCIHRVFLPLMESD